MNNQWSDKEAAKVVSRLSGQCCEALALRLYTSQLLGKEPSLVLHGGGNVSVKIEASNLFNKKISAIYIKASGYDLGQLELDGLPGLELEPLQKYGNLDCMDDSIMTFELGRWMLQGNQANPSIETLVHAFLPYKYIDHTHADAILILSCQQDGKALLQKALGNKIAIIDYVSAGFKLALEVQKTFAADPDMEGIVLMGHGLLTFGSSAKQSYDSMIDLVDKAEKFIESSIKITIPPTSDQEMKSAEKKLLSILPLLRGSLGRGVILNPLCSPKLLACINMTGGKELYSSPPVTPDHLIRTKSFPLWIANADPGDREKFRLQLETAIRNYIDDYDSYLKRYKLPEGAGALNPLPRVIIIPSLGAICTGVDQKQAKITSEIFQQTLEVKTSIYQMGGAFQGLEEKDCFAMEYRPVQHAKLEARTNLPLQGHVSLVTGAAGAIGTGICLELLEKGSHVIVTDLPGKSFELKVRELQEKFAERVSGVPLDVTDAISIENAINIASLTWGGIDLFVINAGLAHVATLDKLELKDFQRLEKVNIEGTLLLFSSISRYFKLQGGGGDVVMISTKNVFAPGAGFGAYSATKAAGHQLARIAGLEMASMNVRVNMVAPDAVFSEGETKSGLWATVGPDRMKARGLDETGLEEYYHNRNLLKTKITARDVGRAVLFFASRQTPTTGATLPVDGGLPDATPR